MTENKSQPAANVSVASPLVMTIVSVVVLIALYAFIGRIEEFTHASFLVPYKEYISVGLVVILGHVAVQAGTKWVFAIVRRRSSSDVAGSMRIIARLVGYGLIFSFMVSVLTDNAVAALTMGSFAGLVAGFASQTVMGNTVAGIFMAISRPIGIGERVTIGGKTGTVTDITLMHVILDTDDQRILIPSSTTVTTVLIKHKASE